MKNASKSAFARFVPSLFACAGLVVACGESREGFRTTAEQSSGFAQDDGGVAEAGEKVACISDQIEAETVPLAMLVLIDRSGSMVGERWTAATKAIRAFADRGEVVGMDMGLNFFPPLGTGDQCSGSSYKNLAVPIAELPGNVIPIQQKLASTTPEGGTPMSSALDGSIAAMREFLNGAPPHEGVVILVTDGDPSGCGSVSTVASIAAAGANPTGTQRRVRTFALGMEGATFTNLNLIAQSGGTNQAYNVGTGAAQQDQLLAALDAVRLSAIGCEYVLPLPSPSQGVLDLETVTVQFTPGENDPTTSFRKVSGPEACGATTGGFYYDDPQNPSRVVLCPASCEDVREAPSASVKLLFGCIQRPL